MSEEERLPMGECASAEKGPSTIAENNCPVGDEHVPDKGHVSPVISEEESAPNEVCVCSTTPENEPASMGEPAPDNAQIPTISEKQPSDAENHPGATSGDHVTGEEKSEEKNVASRQSITEIKNPTSEDQSIAIEPLTGIGQHTDGEEPNSSPISKQEQIPAAEISEEHIRILVVGLIGSGKSSFVAAAVEPNCNVEVSDKADSCTHECKEYRTRYSSGQRRIFLVDTPGFEDRRTSNAEIQKKIARFIKDKTLSETATAISGIIYLHCCTDTRFDSDRGFNFEIVKAMCGPEFYSRVVICSTFWNQAACSSPAQLQRHRKRVESFLGDSRAFQEVMKGGAEYREFWKDRRDPCSDVLNHFLSQRYPPKMAIQDRLMRKKLDETEAAHAVGDGKQKSGPGLMQRVATFASGNRFVTRQDTIKDERNMPALPNRG